MKLQKIRKSAVFNASPEKVWNVLFNNDLNPAWLGEFSANTRAHTDWKEGSKVSFTDESNSGILGTISVSRFPETLDIVYHGFIMKGIEDFESEDAKAYAGSKETYRLTEKDGHTQLDVSSDMGEEHYEEMSNAWDRALLLIKKMAEE